MASPEVHRQTLCNPNVLKSTCSFPVTLLILDPFLMAFISLCIVDDSSVMNEGATCQAGTSFTFDVHMGVSVDTILSFTCQRCCRDHQLWWSWSFCLGCAEMASKTSGPASAGPALENIPSGLDVFRTIPYALILPELVSQTFLNVFLL